MKKQIATLAVARVGKAADWSVSTGEIEAARRRAESPVDRDSLDGDLSVLDETIQRKPNAKFNRQHSSTNVAY